MSVAALSRRPFASRSLRELRDSCGGGGGSQRHESSLARMKKKRKIYPEPSMLSGPQSPAQDHIVFNPPSSAPSVYHTPFAFLPRNDPRRRITLTHHTTTSNTRSPLPPALKPLAPKKYHLDEQQISEIRRLRKEDPERNTTRKLAQQFNCSVLFVSIVCQEEKSKLQRIDQARKYAAPKEKEESHKKQRLREERQKRKQFLRLPEDVQIRRKP